jgi:predicted nucleic acid-binding protein
MKYVLDSNVAIKWVLPEADTPKAVRFRNEIRQGTHEILAPDIYPMEVAHALTKAERRGVIQPPHGIQRLRAVFRYPPALHSYSRLLPRAFEISSSNRHGFYDCLYVALAEQ